MSNSHSATIQKYYDCNRRCFTEIRNVPVSKFYIENHLSHIMQSFQCNGWYRKRRNGCDIILSGDHIEDAIAYAWNVWRVDLELLPTAPLQKRSREKFHKKEEYDPEKSLSEENS